MLHMGQRSKKMAFTGKFKSIAEAFFRTQLLGPKSLWFFVSYDIKLISALPLCSSMPNTEWIWVTYLKS